MKKIIILLLLSTKVFAQDERFDYPEAQLDTATDNYFGTIVPDPYRWLENDSLPATKEWLKNEAKFSEKYLYRANFLYKPEKQLRMNSYVDYGTCIKSGAFYFDYMVWEIGKTPSLYIKKKIDNEEEQLINPEDYRNDWLTDRVRIKGFKVSDDNKYIAFSLSHNGSDWREIHVKKLYPFFYKCKDKLEGVKFSNIEWSGDGFFYKRYPMEGNILKAKTKNPSIWYHKLGDEQKEDVLVYEDNEFVNVELGFHKVKHGNYLIIYQENRTIDSFMGQKVLAIDLNNNTIPFKIDTLISSHADVSFEVIGVYNNHFLVTTTLDAPKGKFVLFSKNEKNKALDFIPEHKEVLHSADIVGNKILCTYLNDVDYISVTYNATGEAVNKIVFPTGTSIDGFDNDHDNNISIFTCHSFLFPTITYQYNVNDFSMPVVKKTLVTYDFTDFEIKKVYFTSKDGTKVPMFIANKKGIKYDGDKPTLLYGYGGYGFSMTPFYSRGFMSFMQNGGIIALPCLRGGGEYGDEWHKKGSKFNKQNVFDDFISAAEYLFKENYTNKEKLVVMGGGGLLVAAVVNQRPDICKVAIAENGVYDMLRYQNYTIGKAWIDEYGTSDNRFDFVNLFKYSPLHNIKEASYPAMLITTADHDDRVVPLHAYKYTAALQHANKSNNPILLYVEKRMGHSDRDVHTDAYIYSFIYEQLKMPSKDLHTLKY